MSGMFWIALELSIPKIGLNVMLSLTVKKLDAFKFGGVAESDNTGRSLNLQQWETILKVGKRPLQQIGLLFSESQLFEGSTRILIISADFFNLKWSNIYAVLLQDVVLTLRNVDWFPGMVHLIGVSGTPAFRIMFPSFARIFLRLHFLLLPYEVEHEHNAT